MVDALTEPASHRFRSVDGLELVYHELGVGRPVLLLHGYLSTARGNWVQTGIAPRLAADGHRLIMPDMRGHGESARAGGVDGYPPDALTSDALALVAQLELDDYDLGGYSLGARTAARMLALGATPRRAFLGATGLEPILHAAGRGENYRRILSRLGSFEPGSFEAQVEQYVEQAGSDPGGLMRVFDTFVDTPREALARVTVPTLVIAGEADTERGSVEELAAVLPRGRLRRVPGDHWSALVSTELVDEIVEFLAV